MKEKIETTLYDDYPANEITVASKFSRNLIVDVFPAAVFQEVVHQVAEVVANKVIEEKLPDILAKITPEAIANMAIAEAGAAINETLHKKMPDKIIEIEKRSTQIYKQGIFGGLKKID